MEGKCESQNERQLKTKALNMSSIKRRQPRSRIRKIKRISRSDKSRSRRFHSLRLKIEQRADHMLEHVSPREIWASSAEVFIVVNSKEICLFDTFR